MRGRNPPGQGRALGPLHPDELLRKGRVDVDHLAVGFRVGADHRVRGGLVRLSIVDGRGNGSSVIDSLNSGNISG